MRRWLPQQMTLCAAFSGLLLALSFPRVDFFWLAWFALVPLLLVMERRPFRSGFVTGVFFFGGVLYWLNIVMTTYGGLPPVLSLVAYLLLVVYLALFFGTATWACCRIREKLGLSPVLTLPVIWVALEFLRSFLLSGFPWATLGYSLAGSLVSIQSADLFGVYGLSYLLILSNVVWLQCWRGFREPSLRPAALRALLWFLLLAGANYGYGLWRLHNPLVPTEPSLRVALIQGNIDQSLKWNPAFQQTTLDIYRDLSLQAAEAGGVDLIVWPESATPFYFQEPGPLRDRVAEIPQATDSYLLFGAPAFEKLNLRYRYLNSAYLLNAQGDVLGRSDKIHLVPFGEYVPMAKFLPFINKLVAGIGDFSPGQVNPLPLNGKRLGVLVCFEAIFPELARDYARQGSSLLVNITNDAWFGRSSAPYQHLAMVRFRAIENRIWVVRAANTGISAFISPSGEISAATGIFESSFLLGDVAPEAQPTLYRRFGDLVPATFLLLTIFWLIGTRRRFVC